MNLKKFIINLISSLIICILFTSVCYADTDEPDITAGAAILIDSNSGKILYSKNSNDKMYPASTTKILTAILTIENCNLDDVVTVPAEAVMTIPAGYTVAALQPGEELTVSQLLQVMMVHSANDAANVLAFYVSGSIESFATLMNTKVAELGLENTHFTNPSGQHDQDHYSTAYDLSIIMQYCMKNSTFRELAGLKSCTIPATNKYEQRIFSTTNELLIYDNRDIESNYYYKYAIAGKTGYTTEAKNCLVAVANKDDLELISVVLSVGIYSNNISGKFVETKSLFDYGYDNYTIRKLREQNAIATNIEIGNATKDTKSLDLLISDDIIALINQNDLETEFTPEIVIDENLVAPIAQNQIVGTISYTIDGITYSSELRASHSVEKSDFITLIIRIIMIILILFLLYKLLFDSNHKSKKFMSKRRRRRIY
jgi:D-alanyl-D-alanine carboxypeptidase (penicillin-binding protein 5/6)